MANKNNPHQMSDEAADLYAITYLEDYIDCMENLPDEIQRHLSCMRHLDIEYTERSIDKVVDEMESNFRLHPVARRDLTLSGGVRDAQKVLIKAQTIGDEQLQLAQSIQDNMENKCRTLELDKKNYGDCEREGNREVSKKVPTTEREIKRARRARHEVFVPSILGPSTLAVTSFVDSALLDGPSTSRQNYLHAQIESKIAAAAAASASQQHAFVTIKKEPSSHVDDSQPRPSGRGNERAGGNTRGGGDRIEEISLHSKATERLAATSSSSTITPKKQTQKSQNTEKKQKKRKAKASRNHDASPPDPIDPDEPTYCLCDQISYGEMIGCDNDLCPIEWFHFSCVSLTHKPKGKWYCPKCRGDKPNIMKSKALFLKELAKYNSEKEEKA